MSVLSSLEACFGCKNEPWNLSIQGETIQKAPFFERNFYYIASFFSSFHENALKERFQELCQKISRMDFLTEEAKILKEKIAACLHRKNNTWFKGVETSLENPSEAKTTFLMSQQNHVIKPIIENGRFVNYLGEKIFLQFLETLRLIFKGAFSKTTELENYSSLLGESHPSSRVKDLEVTWLGHATVLVQMANFNLLFDPAFFDVGFLYKRHIPAGIALEKLPLLDAVMVSHNHDDHCQEKPVKFLSDMQPIAIVPEGFASYFQDRGYKTTFDPSWWQKIALEKDGKKVFITSIPAKHGSQTGLFDINKTHWQGFLVESEGKKIYIAGDTALQEGLFEEINKSFGKIDLAILPIAPEEEESVHLNCEQSLEAFNRLKAKVMVPYHFGGYRQSKELIEDPKTRMEALLATPKYASLKGKVFLPKIGESFDPRKIGTVQQVVLGKTG